MTVRKKPPFRVRGTKITKHHRKPRCFGGDRNHGNISRVERRYHVAYHHLFGAGYPVSSVAALLNGVYLPLDEVLIPVPVEHARRVIAALARLGVRVSEKDIGITDAHYNHVR